MHSEPRGEGRCRSAFTLIQEDLRAAWPSAGIIKRVWYMCVDSGVNAVVMIRIQNLLTSTRLHPFAWLVRRMNLLFNGIDWVQGASAKGGLIIRHPVGIVVGGKVKVGRNATILQNVTLGQKSVSGGANSECPVVGDGVTIGAGSVIVGSLNVGDSSVIGANSVVTRDVPDGAVVAGSPAKILRLQNEECR